MALAWKYASGTAAWESHTICLLRTLVRWITFIYDIFSTPSFVKFEHTHTPVAPWRCQTWTFASLFSQSAIRCSCVLFVSGHSHPANLNAGMQMLLTKVGKEQKWCSLFSGLYWANAWDQSGAHPWSYYDSGGNLLPRKHTPALQTNTFRPSADLKHRNQKVILKRLTSDCGSDPLECECSSPADCSQNVLSSAAATKPQLAGWPCRYGLDFIVELTCKQETQNFPWTFEDRRSSWACSTWWSAAARTRTEWECVPSASGQFTVSGLCDRHNLSWMTTTRLHSNTLGWQARSWPADRKFRVLNLKSHEMKNVRPPKNKISPLVFLLAIKVLLVMFSLPHTPTPT